MNLPLQKKIANKLNYYKQLQEKLDAKQTKASSIQMRKNWLERQRIANYQNEYDRIGGIISQNVIKGISVNSFNITTPFTP